MDESAPRANYKEAPAAKEDKRMFSQTNGVQKQVWLAGTMLTSLSRKVIFVSLCVCYDVEGQCITQPHMILSSLGHGELDSSPRVHERFCELMPVTLRAGPLNCSTSWQRT